MFRRLAFVCVMVAAMATSATADQVDDFVRRAMERNHIPGAAIAVVKDGKVVKTAAYGLANLDWNIPVTPDTRFQIASSTKPLTGLLLMSFVDEGKIKLDESVRTYLPDAPESWQKITIRMLATHTSGLKRDFGDRKIKSLDEAVSEVEKLPLDYEPGQKDQYGLLDFAVMTKLMEKVGGKDYQQLLRERVLAPLGMNDTQFDNAFDDDYGRRHWEAIKGRSTTYEWTGKSQEAYAMFYPKWTYNAGGIFSTVADLAKLLQAISSGKLKHGSLEQMWTPMKLNSGETGGFAIGWTSHRFRGMRVVGHSGGPALSDIAYFPEEKLGMVVLTNQQKFFPMMAESVANFYLPAEASANDTVVDDPNPALTQKIRALLTGITAGTIDDSLFNEKANKEIVPTLKEFGQVIVNQLDPLSKLYLIERKVGGTGTRLVYRAMFGTRPMKWTFVIDRDGKIEYVEPSSGD